MGNNQDKAKHNIEPVTNCDLKRGLDGILANLC